MKHKIFFITTILLALLTACKNVESTPRLDIASTIEIALRQTREAQTAPTATVTHMPTATITPTATSAPTQTPTPTVVKEEKEYEVTEGEEGWQNYEFSDSGFSISLPTKWFPLDLSTDDFEALLSDASEINPELGSMYSSDYLRGLAASGIKMMAIDTSVASLTSPVTTNLNVVVVELPFDLPFDDYVEINLEQIRSMLGEDIQIQQERIYIGDIETEKIEYEAVMNDIFGREQNLVFRQYLMLDEQTQYVLTFSSHKDAFADNAAIFDEIASNFMLLK